MEKDKIFEIHFYVLSVEFWSECWTDSEILMKDVHGKEIASQLIRSAGSIGANIEEGFGRGFGKEYPHFLRIAGEVGNGNAWLVYAV